MKNSLIIFSGLLLIFSAIVIHSFTSESKPIFDLEIIRFLAGICFGVGVWLLIVMFFGKKKQEQMD